MSIVHIYLMKYAFTATITRACTLLGLIIVVCFEFYVDEGIRVLIYLYVYVMLRDLDTI